MTMVKSIC